MKKIITAAAALLFTAGLASAQNQVIKIYDGPAPGSEKWTQPEFTIEYWSSIWNEVNSCVYNVVEPTLTVYRPTKETDTGAAMIVCPGGGFEALSWNNEGPQVAAWLAHHGITAFVLKYRTAYNGANFDEVNKIAQSNYGGAPVTDEIKALRAKNKEIAQKMGDFAQFAYDDGRQAIRYLRTHAEELGIDPHRIGMVGFSAGGALIYDIVKNHDEMTRPDLIGMMYAAMYKHEDMISDPMPCFYAASQFEMLGNALNMYQDWTKGRAQMEIHSFVNARHGFGYRDNNTGEDLWVEMFLNFMKKVGFVK